MSLYIKQVSCREHGAASCFLIHSDGLFLLGALRLWTFKVRNIDIFLLYQCLDLSKRSGILCFLLWMKRGNWLAIVEF